MAVMQQAQDAQPLSDEHFTVDGTFVDARASQKSFEPKDGSRGDDVNRSDGRDPSANFRDEKRSDDTHASLTDPDARLRRKGGDGAQLVYSGNRVTENRHGLAVAAGMTEGTSRRSPRSTCWEGRGVRAAPLAPIRAMIKPCSPMACASGLTPHVAQNESGHRSSTAMAA